MGVGYYEAMKRDEQLANQSKMLNNMAVAPTSANVNMEATTYATPVKLMQKFVNDRGWGDVDVTGMKDWQGNTLSNQTMGGYTSAMADQWAAIAKILQQMQSNYRKSSYNPNHGQNGGGFGGNNSAASGYGGGGGKF